MVSKVLHVMVVFGTRPEAIKMAPVVLRLKQDPRFKVTCAVTGQHRQILDQVLQLFNIVPDIDLDIMQSNQTLIDITCNILRKLDGFLQNCRPDVLLVQGDTSTAFVAGLVSFYHKVCVGHIEAGLRTNDIYDPFPEEMNRRLVSRIAEVQFPPTQLSLDNLKKEGITENIYLTGNTVTDALRLICQDLPLGLPEDLVKVAPTSRVILVETHRRENLGKPMESICRALAKITETFKDVELIFSVHPNPKVREVVMPALQGKERIHLLEPVSYPTLLRLMRASYLILTDSGGIQEEAPSLGVPTLVLRRTTERPEGLDSGNALLVGTDENEIFKQTEKLLCNKEAYKKMSCAASPYGDGHAADRIAEALLHKFGIIDTPPAPFVPGVQ